MTGSTTGRRGGLLACAATGARSELLHLGLREDGALEVPPEGPGSPASWYTASPTPGERGPAVLLGHVNATGGGPGVFADLRLITCDGCDPATGEFDDNYVVYASLAA